MLDDDDLIGHVVGALGQPAEAVRIDVIRALEPLRSQIRDRNVACYSDEWGLTVDWFRARGYTGEKIIESSLRPGGGDLGF